ncbi:hypothetical protein CDCA_CDCA11G3279 [Cyanidium caldarium]|uniref:Glycosyl hydrolase family 13 catalytic domain-containing protein n=1 Tax=Cyanidium caldarium TaxID=2771 RepID=A0AAV9IYC1_CYACA|nr:hypothetical protein CDCA_CDCA11G3279 [Cyanidium caldarium]
MTPQTADGVEDDEECIAESEVTLATVRQELQRVREAYAWYRRNVHRVLDLILLDKSMKFAFEALMHGYTTVRDTAIVRDMCQRLNGGRWEELFAQFYRAVLRYRAARPAALLERDAALPPDWHREPWYCAYVQYFGGTFGELTAMLPYLERLGVRNLFLLPHYESDLCDGGYDVTAYVPRASLGGQTAYRAFMREATRRGFRVATDAILNHTSVHHEWFRRALSGEPRYLDYYLQRNGREKVGEVDRNGDIVCRYRDPDGVITERVCIFPDLDRTHGLWVSVPPDGRSVQFYRTFYPFQVDLNLQNPQVLRELFDVLGRELNEGVLGKRADAVAHWVKRPGTAADGLPETHTLLALLKAYMRHVCARSVIAPEAVRPDRTLVQYAGVATELGGGRCASEGDLLWAFEMQAAIREMLCLQRTEPFWRRVFQAPALPDGATWLNLLGHHDEIYLGFYEPPVRQAMAEYLRERGAVVYKNQMSAGCSYYDMVDRDPERLALALFVQYMAPGTPLVYSGVEVGIGNQYEHAKAQMHAQHAAFERAGMVVPEGACYDPRELQRGVIPRERFYAALEEGGGFGPARLLQRLNQLRRERASLREDVIRPVDTGHAEVLALIRHAEGVDQPLLCVANLCGRTLEAVVPAWQLEKYLGAGEVGDLHMRDVLEGGVDVALRRVDAAYVSELHAYAYHVLDGIPTATPS